MAKYLLRGFFYILVPVIINLSKPLSDNKLFELILKLKDPVCSGFVIVFDDILWNDDVNHLLEEFIQHHQHPVVVMSSQSDVFQTCERNDKFTCDNVIVLSNYPEEFTRIFQQITNCLHVKQIFYVSEIPSDVANRWMETMQNELIILILRDSMRGSLEEIRNWIVNNEIRRSYLNREMSVTREHLGFIKQKNFMGRFLRVATLHFPPVVFIDDSKTEGSSTTIYGIEPSLMDVMASDLNFTFAYFPVSPKEMWGSVTGEGKNRTATGLLGALMKKEADVALGNLYLDYTRLAIVAFSSYYQNVEECFMVPRPKPYPKWTALYHPFSVEVWIATILSIVLSVLTLRFVSILSIESSQLDQYYHDYVVCFLAICGHLFGLQQSQEIRSNAIRLFSIWWLFGALILSTGYRSGLISFMTFPFTPPPIDTIEQLIASPIKKVIYDPLMKEILTNSNNTNMRQLGRQVTTNDNLTYMFTLMDSEEWAVDSNLDSLRYVIDTQYPMTTTGPKVHIMKECIFSMRAALGLQKESPLKPYFDREIQQLIESGLIEYHRTRFARKDVDWKPKTASKDLVSFSLDSLQGAFYSLGICALISLLTFIGEIFIHLSNTPKKKKTLNRVRNRILQDIEITDVT